MTSIRENAAILEQKIVAYQNEMSTEPTQTLSPQEQELLNRNSMEMEALKEKLKETAGRKVELESQMTALKESLKNNLMRRKLELQSKKDRAIANSNGDELARKKKEARSVAKKEAKLARRIAGGSEKEKCTH